MKINKINLYQIKIPLIRPFITAVRRTDNVEDIIIEIETDTGHKGYGSAASTPLITGDSHESIISNIKNCIAPKILGQDIADFSNLLKAIELSSVNNTSAKAAIDIALHDLIAQKSHLPLYKFLGGNQNTINTCITISVKDKQEMLNDAIELYNSGYKYLKIKVGLNVHDDIERIKLISSSLANKVTLLIDANQGYNYKQAVDFINQLAVLQLNIQLIEQPVKRYELDRLKQITRMTKYPIIADESCHTPLDALNIINTHSADGINIKLMKCGGINNANAIYHIANTANLDIMVGCMLESPIGVNAIASFAIAKSNIKYADLDPIALIKYNSVIGGAQLVNNQIVLSDEAGLGILGFNEPLTHILEIK